MRFDSLALEMIPLATSITANPVDFPWFCDQTVAVKKLVFMFITDNNGNGFQIYSRVFAISIQVFERKGGIVFQKHLKFLFKVFEEIEVVIIWEDLEVLIPPLVVI